jgi:glycosyltransferase involved in cell wall biosynthesis
MIREPLENQLVEIALAAESHGLATLPPDFHSRGEESKAEFGALTACRIRAAAGKGDRQAQTFCRQFGRLMGSVPTEEETPGGVRKPRIGFITPGLRLGGAERWHASMIKHLDWSRFECAGLAVVNDTPYDPWLHEEISSRATILSGRRAAEGLCRLSDVAIYWGLQAPKVPHGRLIAVSHGCNDWTRQQILGTLDRATDLVAVSRAAAEVFPEPARATILHNGVDVERLGQRRERCEVRREWDLGVDVIAVGYVGRYSAEKNPLAAAEAVRELGPHFRAVYVGDGHLREEVITAVRDRSPHAIIRPATADIGDVWGALDCFVLASPSEGFSLSLAEAWHCGVPTVATRVGAIPELEEVHGQLVVPVPLDPTPTNLAAAVRQAVSEANRPVVDRARYIARQHYTAGAMAQRWNRFLAKIVTGGRG